MFDFLKEEMPSETRAFDIPKVAVSDVVNGFLDLNRYAKKFNCKWMVENSWPNLGALIKCDNIFGLIEILPSWNYQSPLVLSINNCPNLIGEKLPLNVKTLNISNCDKFSGTRLADMEVGVLNISNCKMVNLLDIPLPKRLGRLVVNKNSGFNGFSDWELSEYFDNLKKRMTSKGFEIEEGDCWVEYTNPYETNMFRL